MYFLLSALKLCITLGILVKELSEVHSSIINWIISFQKSIFYHYNLFYSFVIDGHASVNFPMYEQLSDSPPEILMEDDDWKDSKPGNDQEKIGDEVLRSGSNYRSLEEKRKKASDALHEDSLITIRRDHIVTDLLSAYQDQDLTSKRLLVTIENDDAYGSGVAREMYALFWDTLLSQYAEGDGEFTIPILLTLTAEDYTNLGRILTHQFVQFGAFPVRINQASIQQAIFGHVPDECILSSFLRLLPSREKKCLSNALLGKEPFPVEEVLEVLEDYNIREMPSSKNIRTILLQVAKNELVTKPYMHLLNIRKGMGSFWDDVTKEEVNSLYNISQPTAQRIISCLQCSPKDSKETQTLRWLTRYLKASSDVILSNFLRFCSGTDVVVPGATIALKFNTLPPAAIRPMAKIYFRILYLPKHYDSFSQMRSNLDVYLSNPSKWDLEDNEVVE